MISGKFDPQWFFSRSDAVALLVPASELFGLLRRQIDLPPQWAALLRRETGDCAVMSPGGRVEGRDLEEVLFVRTTPADLEIQEQGLTTRDRFQFRARVALRVALRADKGALLAFRREVLGSHRAVMAANLVRYFAPVVREALGRFTAERNAAELAEETNGSTAQASLREALEAPCFAAGMVMERDPRVTFASEAFRAVRLAQEESARRREEHDAAQQVREAQRQAQARHLDHLAGVLRRLGDLADASPEASMIELIRTFSERERGEIYGALFGNGAPAVRIRWILAAAGDELFFYDPAGLDAPVRRLIVTGDCGSIRSIRVQKEKGTTWLWLGASKGVYRLPLSGQEPDCCLRAPSLGAPSAPRGGFNSVAVAGNRVLASHSELGLLEWDTRRPDEPVQRFVSMTSRAKAVRGVQQFGDKFYCALDQRVISWPVENSAIAPHHVFTGSWSVITALCPTSEGLIAGNSDGDVLFWPTRRDHSPEKLHSGTNRAAESVRLLDTRGVRRVIFTDTSLHVYARVLGDAYTCLYEAGGQTLRRVEAAPDLFVATNDLRDRLICWNPAEPTKPKASIGVSALCGRSIQDVALV